MSVTSVTIYRAFDLMMSKELGSHPSIDDQQRTIERGEQLLSEYQSFDDAAEHLTADMQRRINQLKQDYEEALEIEARAVL